MRLLNKSGFSLVELMIIIAITGVLATIAVPNFLKRLPDIRLRSASREIYGNFQKAKMEAVKRNKNIGIAFTTVAFPNAGGGFTVFIDDGGGDATKSGNANRDPGEIILSQYAMPTGCSLTKASFSSTPNTGYNSRGLPLGGRTGSVDFCYINSDVKQFQISLSNGGYAKIKISNDSGNTWH